MKRKYSIEELTEAGFAEPLNRRNDDSLPALTLVRPEDCEGHGLSAAADDDPYIIENGCLYRKAGDQSKYLANFNAWPVLEIVLDDGCVKSRQYVIKGVLCTGEDLTAVTIPVDQFPSMAWAWQMWGMTPRIQPGQLNKEFVRDYIQSRASKLERQTIYTHTGFRTIDGELAYLYHGGAIGSEGVACELDEGLRGYTFLPNTGIDGSEAFGAVMELFDIAPPAMSIPLLAYMVLAPLNHFLDQVGLTPSFALYLCGETGSFKTTLASLWLACFRTYRQSDPATTNFHSTSNSIERMAHTLKDSPLLVDDYHPSSAKDKARMDDVAQRLARGAGDHLSRKRMNADTSLRQSYTPRCLTMITGEDVPDIGESGLARFFIVKFEKGDIKSADLSRCQGKAEMLNTFMRDFIGWLITNKKTVSDDLVATFQACRNSVNLPGQHARLPQNIAWLQSAIIMVTEFAAERGYMEAEAVHEFRDKAMFTFKKLGECQCSITRDEKPVTKFLVAVNELLSTGAKIVQPISHARDSNRPKDVIGYEDEDTLYLVPGTVMNVVIQYYEDRNEPFPVKQHRLFQDLRKANLTTAKGEEPTLVKRIGNKTLRVLALKKSAFTAQEEEK